MANPTDNIITPFAETNYRNQRKRFGIKTDDRRRHMYIIGKTGMGKTVLLENMIYSDIMNGHGCCYIDPHGDTAEKIINFIPPHRINDVIYFNPADQSFPIAFNPLESVNPEHRHLVASGLVGVFKKLWADSWGPRLEYLLRNAILALLDYPDSTLLGINRLFVDKNFRNKVLAHVKDPVVKSFFVDEFAKYNDKFLSEAIAPIQNKVGQFLSVSLIRNIVGQVKSTIDMRDIMDNKKILIMNLSKGRIGEDASALLGAMMVTKISLAAMSRVDIPEDERNDFYLYVDEFQNFATEAFADILSEARKYHLCLILAHQYIEQLVDEVRSAVFGNVGTLINFRVGAADAELLETEYAPVFTIEDIINLPKYNIYLKLMIDGVASEPFSATTLPPLSKSENNDEKVIGQSRERYAKSREVVEEKINRWAQSTDEQSEKDKGITVDDKGVKRNAEGARIYEFNCDAKNCQNTVQIPFLPDGKRPLLCKEHLKDYRKEMLADSAISVHPKLQSDAEYEAIKKGEKTIDQILADRTKGGSNDRAKRGGDRNQKKGDSRPQKIETSDKQPAPPKSRNDRRPDSRQKEQKTQNAEEQQSEKATERRAEPTPNKKQPELSLSSIENQTRTFRGKKVEVRNVPKKPNLEERQQPQTPPMDHDKKVTPGQVIKL